MGLRNARDTWVENMKIIGYEQSQFEWPVFTWKTENEQQLVNDTIFSIRYNKDSNFERYVEAEKDI